MKGQKPNPGKRLCSLNLLRTLGIGISLSILLVVGAYTSWKQVPSAFASTITLLLVAPRSPFSRPRNVIGGYLLSILVAFLVLRTCGSTPGAEVMAVVGAVLFSLCLHSLHPPASAMAFFVIQSHPPLHVLFVPVLAGTVVIVIVCTNMNTFIRKQFFGP